MHQLTDHVQLLKTTPEQVRAAGLPQVLPPAGLSQERQKYLFKDIRPFVADPYKDELCPPVPEE